MECTESIDAVDEGKSRIPTSWTPKSHMFYNCPYEDSDSDVEGLTSRDTTILDNLIQNHNDVNEKKKNKTDGKKKAKASAKKPTQTGKRQNQNTAPNASSSKKSKKTGQAFVAPDPKEVQRESPVCKGCNKTIAHKSLCTRKRKLKDQTSVYYHASYECLVAALDSDDINTFCKAIFAKAAFGNVQEQLRKSNKTS
jgi:hypothetical protein